MSFGSWPRFADFPDFWTDLSFGHVFGLLPGGVCDFFWGGGYFFPLSLLVWHQISYKIIYNGGSVEFGTSIFRFVTLFYLRFIFW